ncbi:MAG: protein-glutamate O-methyltransferase CheR [Thermotaleaceae bacterium]
MSLYVYYGKDGIKHIILNGELDTREKFLRLIDCLQDSMGLSYITFKDNHMLPADIIDVLHSMQQRNKVKIFVLKPYLYSYLYRLGIFSYYVSGKHILGSSKIGQEAIKSSDMNQWEVGDFLEEIYHCYGYNYTRYQRDSILRRIKICMLKESIKDFSYFRKAVLEDEGLFERLFLEFSINVTNFFRDPQVFSAIREKVLPKLQSFPYIRIWCAGCSSGQEAYSIAILLKELDMLEKVQIYATDINPYVLDEAENGLYSLNEIKKDIENYREAKGQGSFMDYFYLKEGYMEVIPEIKKKVLFFQHNLVDNGILEGFHLILCRNVLIYFDKDLQKNILRSFYHSLNEDGFLILGSSETIFCKEEDKNFYPYDMECKIFKRA